MPHKPADKSHHDHRRFRRAGFFPWFIRRKGSDRGVLSKRDRKPGKQERNSPTENFYTPHNPPARKNLLPILERTGYTLWQHLCELIGHPESMPAPSSLRPLLSLSDLWGGRLCVLSVNSFLLSSSNFPHPPILLNYPF